MLEDIKNKKRPFTVPDGYFSTIEDSVRERLSESRNEGLHPVLSAVKSSLALVVSFLMIFGIGYSVMYLTNTKIGESYYDESDDLTTLIEAGYIKHDFIDYLYDEIDIDGYYAKEDLEIYEELSKRIENNISESELINFIEEYENE